MAGGRNLDQLLYIKFTTKEQTFSFAWLFLAFYVVLRVPMIFLCLSYVSSDVPMCFLCVPLMFIGLAYAAIGSSHISKRYFRFPNDFLLCVCVYDFAIVFQLVFFPVFHLHNLRHLSYSRAAQ